MLNLCLIHVIVMRFGCGVVLHQSFILIYYFYNSICMRCIFTPLNQFHSFYNSICIRCIFTPLNQFHSFYNSICIRCIFTPLNQFHSFYNSICIRCIFTPVIWIIMPKFLGNVWMVNYIHLSLWDGYPIAIAALINFVT